MAGCLDGIRVISMGSAWAGPYCGRMLSELGAEVIRVGAFTRTGQRAARYTAPAEAVEAWRQYQLSLEVPEAQIPDTERPVPAYAENYTVNNYGVAIDLNAAKGKELFKELVKASDVVLSGFSPRVMTNLGLDYPVLREVKPDIIMIAIPALGMTGPDMDMRGFGTAIEQTGGLPSITGYPGGPPHRAAGYIDDGTAAVYTAAAILAALNYRRQTGKGQFIDLSQAETITCMMGEAVMDYSMNKRVAKPAGNRHPSYAPYGCYRCKGHDMWVTIAVTSDDEWCSFCDAIGNPQWTRDDKFSDALSRWKNQGELDKHVEEWTMKYDHYAIQEILQSAGIAAGAVVSIEEQILYDPHIKDRGTYQYIQYPPSNNWPNGRVDPVFRVPWIMPRTPTRLTRPAPYTGRDNEYVFGQVVGLSREEMAKLTEEGILGSNPA